MVPYWMILYTTTIFLNIVTKIKKSEVFILLSQSSLSFLLMVKWEIHVICFLIVAVLKNIRAVYWFSFPYFEFSLAQLQKAFNNSDIWNWVYYWPSSGITPITPIGTRIPFSSWSWVPKYGRSKHFHHPITQSFFFFFKKK